LARIDVWVNNAAVTLFARIEEAPYEAYRKVLETNLFGYIHSARAVLPYFRKQGSGTLINVSSVVGKPGSPFVSAYTISKFGIVGLSESLRMELQDAPDIHVCTVLPASIDTPLFQHAANFMGRAVKPLEPIYSADQVANAIVDLARRPRREIMVGNAGRIQALMHAIAPGLIERRYAKQVEKNHFQDKPAPESTATTGKATRAAR
jgi:short-subunit dehydrogenase